MDDNKFDDIIKRKVGEYEDPMFDPSALSAFHNRAATLEYTPFYSRYRTELLIGGGMAISTFLIIWSFWLFNGQSSNTLEKNNLVIQAQQDRIAKLQSEIKYLRSLPPDTVHIIQFKESSVPVNNFVLRRIAQLESTIIKMNEAFALKSTNVETFENGVDSSLPGSWQSAAPDMLGSMSLSSRLTPNEKRGESLRALPKPVNMRESIRTSFSAKTARELEKHYRNGIGIRLGPTLEFSTGFYKKGTGRIDITGGLLGDFILSPSFSLETGAKFTHRIYEISDSELASASSTLPNVNADLAPLTAAEIDSWILEVPLNLKYRYPLSTRIHGLAGIGYSAQIYTKQLLEYSYNLDGAPFGYISEPHIISDITRYAGTLNISLGLSKRLKNNKILETSLYYQHGLGTAGVEKMKNNFLGIRGAYWFTIK